MPQPFPEQTAQPAPSPGAAVSPAVTKNATTAAPPPHLLWETLETTYGAPAGTPACRDEERLARYIALPLALGLSLVLWVIIVELVLMR